MPSNPTMNTAAVVEPSEHQVVHSVYSTLQIILGIVPIVAGLDKFTNLLCDWTIYLNPLVPRMVALSDQAFMRVVGVIEIIAGCIVFAKPRIGAFVVMAWLIAIALQLVLMGRFLDVAVRDLVIALAGALSLARLSAFRSVKEMTSPRHA